jgi:hypothetical protein
LISEAPNLLKFAKRSLRLLSELHGGNSFSTEHPWQALEETEIAIA